VWVLKKTKGPVKVGSTCLLADDISGSLILAFISTPWLLSVARLSRLELQFIRGQDRLADKVKKKRRLPEQPPGRPVIVQALSTPAVIYPHFTLRPHHSLLNQTV
jgi:hypothetical protein